MRFVLKPDATILEFGNLDWLKSHHPGTIFPKGGPDDDWLADNDYVRVKERPDTPLTPDQRRVRVDPYIDDGDVLGYAIQALPVEEVQRKAKAEVKAIAEAKETGTYWHDIKGDGVAPFQIDDRSQRRLAALHSAIVGGNANPHKDGFTDASNNVHAPVTGAQVKALGEAVLGYIVDVHKHKMTLYAQIDAAQTAADVYAIDIETGWPTDNTPTLD